MEKNLINENIIIQTENYEDHILQVTNKINQNTGMTINGKILYYLEKPIIYYYCSIASGTKMNPFDVDIQFGFEFIDNEIPYITILTEFLVPTLKDNRNYYRCLATDYNYRFSLNDISKHEAIVESIINGIENFLFFLKECIAINSFIFFGEYEYEHIYQINDFLQNGNFLNFYRINEIINKKYEERYILITHLYFIILSPTKEDKALVEIIFYEKLKDMNFNFVKNEKNNSLILKINQKKVKKDLEFILIDRKSKIKNNVNEDINELIYNKDTTSELSILIEEWNRFKDYIDFKKYTIVIAKYKLLFKDDKRKFKIKTLKKEKICEYNLVIEFYEKIVELYEKFKDSNHEERKKKFISNIIYLCSELVDNGDANNDYVLKIRKYIVKK